MLAGPRTDASSYSTDASGRTTNGRRSERLTFGDYSLKSRESVICMRGMVCSNLLVFQPVHCSIQWLSTLLVAGFTWHQRPRLLIFITGVIRRLRHNRAHETIFCLRMIELVSAILSGRFFASYANHKQ